MQTENLIIVENFFLKYKVTTCIFSIFVEHSGSIDRMCFSTHILIAIL